MAWYVCINCGGVKREKPYDVFEQLPPKICSDCKDPDVAKEKRKEIG